VILGWDKRGDDDSEDTGDGGPKLDAGTTAWGEDPAELLAVAEMEIGKCKGCGCNGMDVDSLCVRTSSEDLGGVDGVPVRSRDKRLVAEPTTSPASFKDLTRSAMEVPTRLVVASSNGSLQSE